MMRHFVVSTNGEYRYLCVQAVDVPLSSYYVIRWLPKTTED